MFETPIAIETLIATIVAGGSIGAAAFSVLAYRDTRPKAPARTVEEIVRDAPYEGLANIVKIAKP
ncbi:hypothetical protein GU927_011145 [Rhodobacteraceae bacterium HSP-20]|uniref:Uncharacterized protein n=1 Tax=Paragemmobacter amnigenus TaxID=2852097 RepID=A0ABS6J7Q6_9RHOB|nr:hypothetical protein [Rhodobacter amnigenus]MBU9698400.1 hypothetical protein [Rhodobacter amnigenus]MBV4389627.1 hypothetical protein [Rhodobacter amnigenus]